MREAKDVLLIILILLLLILIPGIIVYGAGAFVMLEWNWIPLVNITDRLAAVLVVFVLWIIFSYMSIYPGYKDDRRDPNKKGKS